MSLERRLYPETGAAERQSVRNFFGRMPARTWPDCCPDCGETMEFVFEPRPARRCARCGLAVSIHPVTGAFLETRPAPAGRNRKEAA